MRRTFTAAVLICLFLNPILLSAQDPFMQGHSWGVGARAMSMGGAYTAVSDDYASLYYNPAGMGQIRKTTLSGTLSFLSMENKATFLGVQTNEATTYSKLTDLGLCFPVPTSRGSLTFGIGYHRVRLLDNGMLTSSYVHFTPEEFPPIGEDARWENEVIENGSLSNTSVGMSIEVSPGLFLGGGINVWGGNDDYTWQFREIDEADSFSYSEYTDTKHFARDFSGVNLTIGALMKVLDHVSLGATVVTPVTLRARNDWDTEEVVTWDPDQVDSTDYIFPQNGGSEYKIRAPWIIRGGIAVHQGPLLVSADAEMANYSEFKYTTKPPLDGYTQAQANMDIKRDFKNVLNTRVGVELTLPFANGRMRAGYAVYPSYLKDANSDQSRKVLSFGAGFRFMDRLNLDVAVGMTSWTTPLHDVPVFGQNFPMQEKIDSRNILFTFSYFM